jgi:hypothetical protein
MKIPSFPTPRLAFWGICAIALGWSALTLMFELRLGWPSTGGLLAKRLIGWGVECWLIRTLAVGIRRYYDSPGKWIRGGPSPQRKGASL